MKTAKNEKEEIWYAIGLIQHDELLFTSINPGSMRQTTQNLNLAQKGFKKAQAMYPKCDYKLLKIKF